MRIDLPPALDDPTGAPRSWTVPDTILAAEKLCEEKIRALLGTSEGKWIAVDAEGRSVMGDTQDEAELAMLATGVPTSSFVVRMVSAIELPDVD